ncbi:GNAT family N-acetyltransferase [Aestuariivirga litoralis]|uniref:GNAT family N-acetyltransferase n=1 Tax=Aestuariivirga litoralis TaxID=2650924 RepID=A0A2W2B778_9HYPH|nr:GNAT family N-acetyltransferase [Aestuariivirga litoralis]PZF75908.1 GNAT family N-acetyltransferase [Aestuariivirga litoralis]
MAYDIGFLDREGIRTACDWARQEGWNPGLKDQEAFAAQDPEGFLGLQVDGELAATISLVSYGPSFGFLGFYICRPDLRGRGLGLALWNEALRLKPARSIGLDGVKAQQANYARSGFVLAHENIRHGGLKPSGYSQGNPALTALAAADAEAIDHFEQKHRLFPAPRTRFLAEWLRHDAMALRRDGEIVGYGVIRQCHEGWKVGPLFADNLGDAETILRGLLTRMPEGTFYLDTPATNRAAVDLAVSLGLKPMFETARMYRGPAPAIDTAKVFGITSFELG